MRVAAYSVLVITSESIVFWALTSSDCSVLKPDSH